MQRYAWIPGIAGFLCIIVFLVYRQAYSDWNVWAGLTGGAGIILLLVYAYLDRLRLEDTAGSRAFRYSSGAFLLVLIALALGVAVNVLANRYDKRWDVTSSKRFTLSEQTIKVLQGLDKKVQIAAFFPADSAEESAFKDLVEGYRLYSPLLELDYHDPLSEPLLAQQFEITSQYGTVVLLSGDDKQRLETTFDEEALTNAIIRVTAGVRHDICFTDDHGELDLDDDYDLQGLGIAVSKLEGQNYQVEKVSLLREGGVPDRCEVLVVAAPSVDPLPVERELLAAYLKRGGAVFMMLEPLMAEATARDLARYGLVLKNDLILEDNPEARSIGLDPSFIIVGPQQLDFHPITTGLKAGLLLQTVRSVAKSDEVPTGLDIQVLARTTSSAWAETSLDGNVAAQPDPAQDIVGDVPLMAVAEISDPDAISVADANILPSSTSLPVKMAHTPADSQPADRDPAKATPPENKPASPREQAAGQTADSQEDGRPLEDATSQPQDESQEEQQSGKLVVVGDASFATNQLIIQGMNQDLFLNTIAWLVGEEDQVSIRPNEAAKSTLQMNMAQGVLLWFLAILGVPGLALAGAIGTWIHRRRL